MAATIRGTFELIDKASSTLKKIEVQALQTQKAVEGVGTAMDAQGAKSAKASNALDSESKALRSFGDDLEDARKKVDDLGESHDDLSRKMTEGTRSVGVFQRGMESLRGELSKVSNVYRAFKSELSDLPGGSKMGSMFGSAKNMFGDLSGFAQQSSTMKQLKSSVSDLGEAFSGLGEALNVIKFPAIASAIQPLIGVVDSLGGGLVALVPKIMQTGAAMEAIPAAASLGIQAFGTFKLALSGVGNALSTYMQMQAGAGQDSIQFGNQMQSATDAVTTSQQGLNTALYTQTQSQIALTTARQQATRELQDMAFASKDAVLQNAQANLNIQEARQQLQQAMATPGTTQLQLQQLRLGVQEAQAAAVQTKTQGQRANQDYSEAISGNAASQPVQQMAEAQHNVTQAVLGVKNAVRGLKEAQDAENQTQKQGTSGAQSYKKSLDALGPAQRQFVKFVTGSGLLSGFRGLQNAAAKGLFPALEGGLGKVNGIFGALDKVATRTGRSLGTSLSGALKVFADPKWITNVGDKNVGILNTLGKGFDSIAKILKVFIPAGQQFTQWFADLATKFLKGKAAFYETGAGAEDLRKKFKRAEAAITEIAHVVMNLWDTFRNIGRAATGLGNDMWAGAEHGTKGWAKWTGDNQKKIAAYFNGLKPTLVAVGKLVAALGKAFVDMGSPGKGGQSGATSLVNTLTRLVPSVEGIIKNFSAFLPITEQVSTAAGHILGFFSRIAAVILKIPYLPKALGLLVAVTIMGRFVSKISEGARGIGKLGKMFLDYRNGNGSGGMASPGTGGAGTGVADAISASERWGIRSMTGPGSEDNPLVVSILGSRGTSIARNSNSLEKDAESDVDKDAKGFAKEDGKASETGISRLLSKVGLGGRAAGDIGEVGSIGSKLAPIAESLGKIAGPVGIALTALPAITKFFSTSGSIGHRLGAAGDAAVSSATFGLIHPGAPTQAHQAAQGDTAADKFLKGLTLNRSGGFSASSLRSYQSRINKLQGDYELHAHGRDITTQSMDGQKYTENVGKNTALRQADFADLTTLKTQFAKQEAGAGTAAASSWQDAFSDGINNGQKPTTAMGNLLSGLNQQMKGLTPAGQQSLDTSMAAWGAEIVQQNPKMKGPIDQLNQYIENSFDNMGSNVATSQGNMAKNIQIVNGQILTGSSQQWSQIETALTNPMDVAQEKLKGSFKAIQREAVSELQAMGFSKSDAQTLISVGGMSKKALNWDASQKSAASASSYSGKNSIYGPARAGGGRVAGGDMHDVYAFGGNMLGGGEMVMNRHQEMNANARLMRHGEPTIGSIVSSNTTAHWAHAYGGRAAGGPLLIPNSDLGGIPGALVNSAATSYATAMQNNITAVGGGGATDTAGGIAPAGAGSLPSLPPGANAGRIAAFFRSKGLSKIAIAGIIGNWMQESTLNPNLTGASGLGIAQWIGSRRAAAYALAAKEHTSPTNIALQLQYAWSEMAGGDSAMLAAMNRAKSPGSAAELFEQGYEEAGDPMMANRMAYAVGAYKQGYAGGGRMRNAGWFANGGSFTANSPTVMGVGESGPEKVTVTPLNRSGGTGGGVTVNIEHIEVNRPGDIADIVNDEMKRLAATLDRTA